MILQIKGTVKPLAVMSPGRVVQLPELPTVIKAALRRRGRSLNALFAPKGTPQGTVDQLFGLTECGRRPRSARVSDLGAVIPPKVAACPQALRAMLRRRLAMVLIIRMPGSAWTRCELSLSIRPRPWNADVAKPQRFAETEWTPRMPG
jgi:hypothetical protein